MREAIKSYWHLLVFVVVVCVIALGLFGIHFFERPLSDDSNEWANFANYVSGTVGVAVLAGTLLAFLITLHQQNKLIEKQDEMIKQQDDMIEQQKRQLDEAEIHQRKTEAYTRAEKIFPTLLSSCKKDLGECIAVGLSDNDIEAFKPKIVSPNKTKMCFFNELQFPDSLRAESRAFLCLIGAVCTDKPYKLARFVAECLRDAPELKEFFHAEIGEYIVVVKSSLAYNLSLRKDEVEEVCRLIGLPISYYGLGIVESKWQEIGELIYGEN
ncbi:hypothetical protein ACFO0U_00850 [Chromohalobacter sarecensis]|uniref:Phage abortive infection protein n=1 Tax=Chromohalobacter sarecensis TaxID=245294 RepID=A0ABV9CXC5_9GAMM|nr:hypothetical protein [Chromohalobacter sarecensis]MCK0715647.1 hypothetical protein [Chromohalobacter sarecensis]